MVHMNSSMTDPGPAGAGQTWNFGAATSTSSLEVTFADCSAVPDCSMFPGTNLVTLQDDGGVGYMKANSTMLAYTGIKTPVTTMTYSDQEEMLRFPFTYNDNYTDNWSLSFVTAGITWYRKGTTQVTADAYGTLSTPAGTFPNVLRLHTLQTYRDSMVTGGMPVTIDYLTHIYTWYSTTSRYILYSVSEITTGGMSSANGTWVAPTLAVHQAADLKASLEVFPQPATNTMHLRFNNKKQAQLSISLMDISGRTVLYLPAQDFAAGQNETTVDLSHLQGGIYFLQLKEGTQSIAVQKIQKL